jgi:hypothetical protein
MNYSAATYTLIISLKVISKRNSKITNLIGIEKRTLNKIYT